MSGIDAHVVDEIRHDGADLPATVQQVRAPSVMRHARHQCMPGQHELAQVIRADERARLEAHVVAAPEELHPLELQQACG